MNIIRNACALLLAGMSTGAIAQTMTVGTANLTVGATQAVIPVTFTSGATVVGSVDFTVNFTRVPAVANATTVTVVDGTGSCGGALDAETLPANNTIVGGAFALDGSVDTGTLCTLTFTLDPATAPGNYALTLSGVAFTAPDGVTPVTPNPAVTPGAIIISAGPPADPVGTVADPADFAAATSIGGTTITTGAITAVGGANGGSATVTCASDDAQIAITSVNPAACNASNVCTPAAVQFTCTATNAAQTANISCTSDGPNSTPVVQAPFAIACPAANVNPTLSAAPAADADNTSDATPEVTLPTVGIGQVASANVLITPAGGSGAGTASMASCVGAGGISVTPASLTFAGGTLNTAQNLAFSCTAVVAAFSGTVTCTETDGDTPAGATRVWDVLCPAGTPESAPGVTYNPAVGPLVFAQGASIGSPTTQQVTVDINGGLDGGDATLESTSVTCSTASAGFSVGSTGGPFSANAPASIGVDGTVTVTCSAAATAQAGTLSCVSTPRVDGVAGATTTTDFALNCPAAAINITANPGEGAIALTGAPGSAIPGSIAITSTGSASTLTCTVGGAVTAVSPLVQAIPAGPNGSVSFAYTCLAGSPGIANVGTISCTTGATTQPNDVLDYTLSCSGAANAPIPTMGGLGKALLVSLMIGLGLLGLGARRQMI